MIGFYNYTELLTYLSLISASTGIALSFMGQGHPFIGMICLLFCAFCDSFDGKVARLKKDRTDIECKFGIQIDSLSDVIAFGVLPASIGMSLLFKSEYMYAAGGKWYQLVFTVAGFAIMAFFVLAALIRLAYFNVTEEERQKTESGPRKYYVGLPVTLSAIIMPIPFAVQMIVGALANVDITYVYFIVMLGVAFAFISKFHLKKPDLKMLVGMVIFGSVELAALILAFVLQ